MTPAACIVHSIGPRVITDLSSSPLMVNFSTESKIKKNFFPRIYYAPTAFQCTNGILTTVLCTANLLQLEALSAKRKLKELMPNRESEMGDKHLSVYNSLPA